LLVNHQLLGVNGVTVQTVISISCIGLGQTGCNVAPCVRLSFTTNKTYT